MSRCVARGAVPPLLLLVVWQAASSSGAVDPRLLPPLPTVLATAWDEAVAGRLARDLAASLARDLSGFALGASAGFALGVLLGLSRPAERLLGPSFDALKQIAIFAWIPLISMWFGIGEAAKVAFVALAAFTPMVVNAHEGVRSVQRQLVEVGAVLTFTRWQRLTRVILPAAVPSIMTGLHLALIYAWLATVGAEYFMTVGPGVGGLIIEGRERFRMDHVLVGILALGAIGFLMSRVASTLETWLLRWRPA